MNYQLNFKTRSTMKRKIISSVFALALLATVGFGVNKSMQSDANLSDLALSNVEALADGESGDGEDCYNTITTKRASKVLYCGTCSWVDGTNILFSGTDKC